MVMAADYVLPMLEPTRESIEDGRPTLEGANRVPRPGFDGGLYDRSTPPGVPSKVEIR